MQPNLQIHLRTLHRRDAATLMERWNQSASFDPLAPGLLDEKVWQDPDHDKELCLVAETSAGLVGFGMGVARQADDQIVGFLKLLAVATGHQRQGIGSALLRTIEQRLAARGAKTVRVGESAPNYLTPGVDMRYQPATRFFPAQGYQPLSESVNMIASLENSRGPGAEDLARLESAGIHVRRATTSDARELNDLLRQFGGTWEAEVACSLRQAPARVHLAFRGDELLGFAACEGNNVGTGWFGPMGTTQTARGLGIGKVLLDCCLADLAALGHEQAIIPWVGPVGFYAEHIGARVYRKFQRFEKVLG